MIAVVNRLAVSPVATEDLEADLDLGRSKILRLLESLIDGVLFEFAVLRFREPRDAGTWDCARWHKR